MIRDISDVVIDVSHTTIINTSNIAIAVAAYAQDSWKSLAPSPPLLEPSANDISGILLRTTIIQGTDLSGITIGDNCTASGEYAVAMGWGADASGTEGFVYRDICSNVFAFDSGPPAVLRVNHQDPDAGGGTGGDLSQNMLSDFDASGTIETSGVILAPVHSAEGSSQSVITELDPSKNPLMTKGMMWINEAQDISGWSTGTPMDMRRMSLSAASLGGKLYAVGGTTTISSPELPVATTEVYDPIDNSWNYLHDMLEPRVAFGVAALKGKLYAVGGSSDGTNFLNTAECYDPSTNSWSNIKQMATPRTNHGVAALGGKLYVAGGAGDGLVARSSVGVYDPTTNSWTDLTIMNTDRFAPGLAALGGKLYAVGGSFNNGTSPLAGAEVYDPISNSWEPIAAMNTGRAYPGLTALGGKLYVVGGEEEHGPTNSAEVYDPMDPSAGWNTIDSMNINRFLFSLAALGGKLYSVGGTNAYPSGTQKSVEVYDPSLVQMPQITYQGEDFYVSHSRGGPKTFIIPHPEHEGKMLRHACLEAPTRGTNVYEYQITTTEDNQTTEVALPSYFKHINGRVRVYVSVVEQNEWGGFGGSVNDDLTKAIIETEKSGTYNVMVTGVRKDPEAVAYSATENIDDPIDEKDI